MDPSSYRRYTQNSSNNTMDYDALPPQENAQNTTCNFGQSVARHGGYHRSPNTVKSRRYSPLRATSNNSPMHDSTTSNAMTNDNATVSATDINPFEMNENTMTNMNQIYNYPN